MLPGGGKGAATSSAPVRELPTGMAPVNFKPLGPVISGALAGPLVRIAMPAQGGVVGTGATGEVTAGYGSTNGSDWVPVVVKRDRPLAWPGRQALVEAAVQGVLRTSAPPEVVAPTGVATPTSSVLVGAVQVAVLDGQACLVFAAGGAGTLAGLLPTLGRMGVSLGRTPGLYRALWRDILCGVVAAHEAGVAHNDLTPANVLITALDLRDVHNPTLRAALVDFASATLVPDCTAATRLGTVFSGVPTTTRTVDTPVYPAPVKAPFAADAFAVGMLMLMSASGDPWPFAAMNAFGTGKRAPAPAGAGAGAGSGPRDLPAPKPETTFDERHQALKEAMVRCFGGIPSPEDPAATGQGRVDVVVTGILNTFPTLVQKLLHDCATAGPLDPDPATNLTTLLSALTLVASLVDPVVQQAALTAPDGGKGLCVAALDHPFLKSA